MKDIYFIFRREFYLVFRDHAVLTFFIFLCLGYPLIYTFIYSNEVVRQVPVAVIDQSKSPLSREFLRMWEASPNVKVVAHCNDLGEAQLFMWQKEIYGILEIPADFSKDINRGEQAHVALFCDMGALLNYKALLQATSDVAITLGKEIQVENLPYASRIQQEITASPVEARSVFHDRVGDRPCRRKLRPFLITVLRLPFYGYGTDRYTLVDDPLTDYPDKTPGHFPAFSTSLYGKERTAAVERSAQVPDRDPQRGRRSSRGRPAFLIDIPFYPLRYGFETFPYIPAYLFQHIIEPSSSTRVSVTMIPVTFTSSLS